MRELLSAVPSQYFPCSVETVPRAPEPGGPCVGRPGGPCVGRPGPARRVGGGGPEQAERAGLESQPSPISARITAVLNDGARP
ncbi:unnamed protein product [Gadus morhua 'NCC']